LKIIRSEEKVNSIVGRLERVRDEVQFHIVIGLRKTLASINTSQEGQLRILDSHVSKLADRHDRHDQLARERHVELIEGLNSLKTIRNLAQTQIATGPRLHKSIGAVALEEWDQFEEKFLTFLGFRQMADRENEVETAHQRTFQWIFNKSQEEDIEQTWDSFVDWLQNGKGCYWINGKAGSGKSTLMKYISNEPATRNALAAWAGPKRLCIASFYFWKSGTALQKSQTGLYRSLLYSVLSKSHDLIPICFPYLFGSLLAGTLDLAQTPSIGELRSAFSLLNQQEGSELRLCFFIDGVDEFDGDYMELAKLLKTASNSSMLKVVLSSRPIPECVDAFGDCPKLQLQDLTRPDIKAYVDDVLGNHHRVQRMSREHRDQASALVDEIVTRASGVFLWVILVTKSLLTGLRNFDNLDDLNERLAEFPPELHDLYKHMIANMDRHYRRQASHLLQIVFQAMSGQRDHPLTALQLSFADQTSSLAISTRIERMTFEEKHARCESMEGRLRSRLCGLVELHKSHQLSTRSSDPWEQPEPPELILTFRNESSFWQDPQDLVESTVGFLHQTVLDFLREPEIWSYILSLSDDPNFDANTALLASCLLLTKCMGERIARRNVLDCLSYAEMAEDTTKQSRTEFLDELDRCMSYYWQEPWIVKNIPVPLHHQRHWSVSITYPGGYLQRHSTFFSLAVHKGLVLYVAEFLRHKSSEVIGHWDRPLLVQLLRDFQGASENLQVKYVTILEMLLQHGASPNREHNGDPCAWFEALRYVHFQYRDLNFSINGKLQRGKVQCWLKIMEAFINFGAEPNAVFNFGPSPHAIVPLDCPKTPLAVLKARQLRHSAASISRQPTGELDDADDAIKAMESNLRTLLLQQGAIFHEWREDGDEDDEVLLSRRDGSRYMFCVSFNCFRRSHTPENGYQMVNV
jgi:hypothetical protein